MVVAVEIVRTGRRWRHELPGSFARSAARSGRNRAASTSLSAFFRAREEPRHQVAAEVVAGRRRSYGDAADRQRDRANKANE
jgi:hypothetical protein